MQKKQLLQEKKKNKMVNKKLSRNFDKKYGTKTFQKYKFPENKTADQVWNSEKLEMRELAKKLTAEHFPPMDGMKLGIFDKREILKGMASGFNHSDIFFFSFLCIYASHPDSLILRKLFYAELKKSQGKKNADNITRDIHWVISPSTAVCILSKFNSNFDPQSFISKYILKRKKIKS
jgi:hypothetical protein